MLSGVLTLKSVQEEKKFYSTYTLFHLFREPIPTRALDFNKPMGKQVCVFPFCREFLLQYIQLSPTPLEIAESIETMCVRENGLKVRMVPTKFNTKAVDTEEDRLVVESLPGSNSI